MFVSAVRAHKFIAKTFDAAERTFHIKTSSFCPAASVQLANGLCVCACLFACCLCSSCMCWCVTVVRLAAWHECASQARTLHFSRALPSGRTYVQQLCVRAPEFDSVPGLAGWQERPAPATSASANIVCKCELRAASVSAQTGRGTVATETARSQPNKVKPEHILR